MESADKIFFADLYVLHRSDLHHFLLRRLRNEQDARDVAQSAYARMLASISRGEVDNARAFLFRTAANLAIDLLRYRERTRQVIESAGIIGSTDSAEPTPEENASHQARLRQLTVVLDMLSPKCRTAFLLHRFDGLTYPAIAARLGVSTSMVKKYVRNAHVHCHKHLQLTE